MPATRTLIVTLNEHGESPPFADGEPGDDSVKPGFIDTKLLQGTMEQISLVWDASVVSTDEDEMPVLVKGPQVSSIGTLLSGDSEEEGARKRTRPATTDCDWIPQ